MKPTSLIAAALAATVLLSAGFAAEDPTDLARREIRELKVGENDWPQWGGWSGRNNTPKAFGIPTEWDVESEDDVIWSAPLGSQSYGNPVVANGQAFVGTNNHHGYLARYPKSVDLGVLAAFDANTGEFQWQHSSPKLSTGRVHDWPDQGICAAPCVDGERLWYVTSRGEVACLDTKGFTDGENDGPYTSEPNENADEGDVIWLYDMMGENNVSQHNMCSCSVMLVGDYLLVNTSNGVDESHINIPSPSAPSFMVLNRDTGEVIWTDNSPGQNILHGQWSSPGYCEIGGRKQVLMPGGDGWLYSFSLEGKDGNAELLWKFDCNPKDSKWILGGRGTRNNLIGTPVTYDKKIYIAVGQDPEHGEGVGHLWCIDPTGSGDVSPTSTVDASGNPIDYSGKTGARRLQNMNADEGEKVVENENSKAIWHYTAADFNSDGDIDFEEEMHRSCGTVAIKNDLLYIADFSGLFHCLDAQTGDRHFTYDMLTAAWGSPLIVQDHVYIGNEDGYVLVFDLDKEASEPEFENDMGNSVYSTPIVANDRLYIANKSTLFCIGRVRD